MTADLAPDIGARIERDFGAGALAGIESVLQPLLTGDRPGELDRIVRCVIVLAAGDVAALRHNVEQALLDYRDVIYWAEYDANGRTADYGQPFVA